MKQKISILLIILMVAFSINGLMKPNEAKAAFEWTTVKSSGQDLQDVECVGNTCYAVGGSGAIFKSTNGGVNWSDITQGTGYSFNAIDCVDADNCFIAGTGGGYKTILKTINGGASWVAENAPDSVGQYYDISMINTSTGFTTTNGSERYDIYRTPDQGHGGSFDWELVVNGGSYLYPTRLHFFSSSTGLWWGGGDIYRSTNANTSDSYSVTWSRQYDGSAQAGDIFCYDANECWASGGTGFIAYSSNGGVSWSPQTSGSTQMLWDIGFGSTTNGWAVGSSGAIVKTTNGGTSWSAETGQPSINYNGVYALDDSTVIAVGAGGYIIRGAELGESVSTTLTIDNAAPSFDVAPADDSDGTTPTNEGDNVTFTATASDINGDDYYVLICSAGSTVSGDSGGAAPSCSGGTQYAVSAATTSGQAITPITFDTTGSSSESYDWIGFVCDDNSPSLCSSSSSGNSPFKVNHAPAVGTVKFGETCNTTTSVDPGNAKVMKLSEPMPVAADGDTIAVDIQSDGKIVAAGGTWGGADLAAIFRYNADGTLDTTFDSDGKLATTFGTSSTGDYANAIKVQSDGKIVVVGNSSNATGDIGLLRLNSDGSLDTSFDTDGKVTTPIGSAGDSGNAMTIQDDGKILVAGDYFDGSSWQVVIARYNTDGSLDTAFDTDGKVTNVSEGTAHAVVVQTDGKIVIAGQFYNGSDQDLLVMRFNSNGSPDTFFDTDGIVTTDVASGDDNTWSLAIQDDGKIVVAGTSNDNFSVVRYNTNGSLDTSFDTDGKVTTDFGGLDHAYGIVIQSDDKIVLSGDSNQSGNTEFAAARYNTNGSLDTTFDTDGKVTTPIAGVADYAWQMAIQNDGKLVLVGGSEDSGGGSAAALIRYNTDGSVESLSGYACMQVAVTDTDVDTTADTIDVHVCSTNSFSGGACGDTTLCSITGAKSGDSAQCVSDGLVPVPTAHDSYNAYVFLVDENGMTDGGSGGSNTYSVTDILPQLGTYTPGTPPSPPANGGDTFSFSLTLKDDNGDNDVTNVEGVFFDPVFVDNDCEADQNTCYITTCALTGLSTPGSGKTALGTDENLGADCTMTVYFNANPSDWDIEAKATDSNGETAFTDAGVALTIEELTGISVIEESISYGSIAIGGTSPVKEISMGNVGNRSMDILVQGSDMCIDSYAETCSSYYIPISAQRWHHSDSTFDFDSPATGDGPYPLVSTASTTSNSTGCVNHTIQKRDNKDSETETNQSIFWKLRIPGVQQTGSYYGEITFASTVECDPEICDNSIDDDGDGRIDCTDHHDCDSSPSCSALDMPMTLATHDTGNTQTLDLSANSNHGDFGDGVTPTTYPTKLTGPGYSFDGGDYFTVADDDSLDITDELTVALWIKIDSIPGDYIAVIEKAEGNADASYMFYVTPTTAKFRPHIYNATQNAWSYGDTSLSLTPGIWYHFVYTYDSTTGVMKAYVDAQEATISNWFNTPDPGDTIKVSTAPLYIGKDTRGEWNLNGSVADVKIFDYVLDLPQINDLFLVNRSNLK